MRSLAVAYAARELGYVLSMNMFVIGLYMYKGYTIINFSSLLAGGERKLLALLFTVVILQPLCVFINYLFVTLLISSCHHSYHLRI